MNLAPAPVAVDPQQTRYSIDGFSIQIKVLPEMESAEFRRYMFTLVTPTGEKLFGTKQDYIGLRKVFANNGKPIKYASAMACLYALQHASMPYQMVAANIRDKYAPLEVEWAKSKTARDLYQAVEQVISEVFENLSEYNLTTLQ